MEYNVGEFITDFARRTMYNYELIEKKHKDVLSGEVLPILKCEEGDNARSFYRDAEKPFEVTQLINSLFGFIIMPTESFKKKIELLKKGAAYRKCRDIELEGKKFLGKIENNGRYYSSFDGKYDIFELTRRMRNALAHSGQKGLHFYPISDVERTGNGGSRAITHIVFYDTDKEYVGEGRKFHEFCIKLKKSELETLMRLVYRYYVVLEHIETDDEEYRTDVAALNNLLKRKDSGSSTLDAFEQYRITSEDRAGRS